MALRWCGWRASPNHFIPYMPLFAHLTVIVIRQGGAVDLRCSVIALWKVLSALRTRSLLTLSCGTDLHLSARSVAFIRYARLSIV